MASAGGSFASGPISASMAATFCSASVGPAFWFASMAAGRSCWFWATWSSISSAVALVAMFSGVLTLGVTSVC